MRARWSSGFSRCAAALGVVAMALLGCTPSVTPRGSEASGFCTSRFTVVVLGASGGLYEDELAAFLVAPGSSTDFVALDAGTLLSGIRRARVRGSLADVLLPPGTLDFDGWLLREKITAYLLSHGHLDHVAGLVIASPDDAAKPIYGLSSTLDAVAGDLFNGRTWANFTTEGSAPLGKYNLVRLVPGRPERVREGPFTVSAHPLSHTRTTTSTAFLLEAGGAELLYLGDTGPDAVEGGGRLGALWTRVAPLVRRGTLRAVLMEVSYANGRPDALLFGHLTPAWLSTELRALANVVRPSAPEGALAGVTLVITHIKPSLARGVDARALVSEQLVPLRELGLRVVVPQQGDRIAIP